METTNQASCQYVPLRVKPFKRTGSSQPSYPRRLFASHPDYSPMSVPMQRSCPSINEGQPWVSDKRDCGSAPTPSSGSVLKSGQLTWKDASEGPGKKWPLSGFEKALRRRQAARHHTQGNHSTVFVALEKISCFPTAEKCMSRDVETPASQTVVTTEPFLASLETTDRLAFKNSSLLPLMSPSIPASLSDRSRWLPPSDWGVLSEQSDDLDSRSRSPASSSSDPLQTPTSSQPGSPREHQLYLNLYTSDLSKGLSASTLQRARLMSLRITCNSKVEIQSAIPSAAAFGAIAQPRQWQLVVTGEQSHTKRPQDLQIPRHLYTNPLNSPPFQQEQQEDKGESTVCFLASQDKTELIEWLYCIEDAIRECRSANRTQFEVDETSWSLLEETSELDQLDSQDRYAHTPRRDGGGTMGSYRHGPLTVSTRALPSRDGGKAFKPDSAAVVAEKTTTTAGATGNAHFDLEDTYASILQRFYDYEIPSPSTLEGHSSGPLTSCARHARPTECLDVPVSPYNSEVSQDHWDEVVEAPTSPVDPWLTQPSRRRSASGLYNCNMSPYADETVMRIFAEGFRGSVLYA